MAGEISDEVDEDVLFDKYVEQDESMAPFDSNSDEESVGRPCKARRRKPDEPNNKQRKKNRGKQPIRMKRQQFTVTCRICGVPGHNSTTCVKNGFDQPVKKLRVRKKKNGVAAASIDTIEQGNASTTTNADLGGLQNVPPTEGVQNVMPHMLPSTEDDFLLNMEMNQIFDYLSQPTSGVSFQPTNVQGPAINSTKSNHYKKAARWTNYAKLDVQFFGNMQLECFGYAVNMF
ncbi:hypothetical protein DH2020_039460 [Rehmannia glutinosa]|uniref:Uncharacterized protein n=1 Tax=Rehmannia glutinosa TaxID=99300 RepID=A0ABR0UXY0_REHGL